MRVEIKRESRNFLFKYIFMSIIDTLIYQQTKILNTKILTFNETIVMFRLNVADKKNGGHLELYCRFTTKQSKFFFVL